MDTVLALSSEKKTSEFRKRINKPVTRIRSIKELLKWLAKDEPVMVIVDIALPSMAGEHLLDRIRGRVRGDLLVVVDDLSRFDPRQVAAAFAPSAERKPAIRSSTQKLLPELHSTESGRIDAVRVASFFGISLNKLARTLGRTPQSVHKTPDSERLQKGLGLFLRIASGLMALLGTGESAKIWLNSPNPDLDHVRPLELIEKGRGEVVAELIEDTLLGHPS